MSYTNAWDVTTPAGTEQAKKIDDHFRRLRLDIQERMNEIFVSFAASPVTLKDEIKGKKTGKIMMVPFPDFVANTVDYNAAGNAIFTSSSEPARAPLKMPLGVVIKKVRWLISCSDSTSTTFALKSCAFNVGATPVVETVQTKGSAGGEIMDSGTLTITIDGTKYFWLEADRSGGGTFSIYAVEITYDAADSRSTM